MKKKLVITVILITVILIISQFCSAETQSHLEDLGQYESLTFDITIASNFELEETSQSSSFESALVEFKMKVQDNNDYTNIISESTNSEGEIQEDFIEFTFSELEPLEKTAEYFSRVEIDSSKHQISSSKTFPIELSEKEIQENDLNRYLETTEIIDWENEEIRRRASTIAQGQTDLFATLVTLADWVEQNIEYNLSSLNAESSFPASSVLESRQGVCDEITSLFISFSRSLGIPARFVSGLTYTRNDLFDEPWQSHGWAEVYLPDIGWVSFDPTFGQFGFVDATHIPLQYSSDPTENSLQYQWAARNINLIGKDTDFEVQVVDYGPKISNNIKIQTESFNNMINFGSYNLISANIENQDTSFQAVELQLIVPEEVTIISEEKDVVVIGPKETYHKEWIILVDENLKSEYIYTFPYYVIANNLVNGTNTFSASTFNPTYDYEEISSLITITEDDSFTSELSLKCSHPESISVDDSTKVTCEIENKGNKMIEDAKFCIHEICEYFDLLLAETKEISQSISFEESEIGYQNIPVSLIYEDISENDILSVEVLDETNILLTTSFNNQIYFKENLDLNINLDRMSISLPQDIILKITTPTEIQTINISNLEGSETLDFKLDSSKFASNNNINIELTWSDVLNRKYNYQETVEINAKGRSILDKIQIFFNGFLIFLNKEA